MTSRILVVEDDPSLVDGLRSALEGEGYQVDTATDGKKGFERARDGDHALVVLDIMLPGMSGLEIAKRLRDGGRTTPIILLTARGDENDRVLGLELGADDYVTKPFSVRELLARIKAVLKRAPGQGRTAASDMFRFGAIEVDFKRQRATKSGLDLELSTREFKILAYFIEHRGEMLSREQLLNEIWGYDVFPTTRTVDNHIARLRKKIEDEPDAPRWILTQRGAGYVFET